MQISKQQDGKQPSFGCFLGNYYSIAAAPHFWINSHSIILLYFLCLLWKGIRNILFSFFYLDVFTNTKHLNYTEG